VGEGARAARAARGTGAFACAALDAAGAGADEAASAVVVAGGGAVTSSGATLTVGGDEAGSAVTAGAFGRALRPMTPAAATAAATPSPTTTTRDLRLRRRVLIRRSAVVDAVVDASVAAVGETSPLPMRLDLREPPVVCSFVSESACAPSWLSSFVRPSTSSAAGMLARGKATAGSPKERTAASVKRRRAACTSVSDCGRAARSRVSIRRTSLASSGGTSGATRSSGGMASVVMTLRICPMFSACVGRRPDRHS
jgi:hypothetical protein